MFAAAREPKTHFPPLLCRPWAALPARTTLESRTSCALSSRVFAVAKPGGSFRSLRLESLLPAHVGQPYRTPECLHFRLCTFGTLLRTARLNLSTPVIRYFARVATLLFCVAFVSSFSSAAPVRSQHPQDNPSGQTNIPRTSEPSPAGEVQPRQKKLWHSERSGRRSKR